MDEILDEIVKKRDKTLELYHNSVKHEDIMYHSGWGAGLEYAINLILQSKKKSSSNAPLPEPKGKGDDSEDVKGIRAEPEGEVGGQTGESKEIKDIFDDYHEARDEAYRRTMASNDMGTIKHYYQARMIYIDGKSKWKVESSR